MEKDKKIKVSIIIPTCGLFQYLNLCLRSIYLHTTKKEYEIIIIDNGSRLDLCKAEKMEELIWAFTLPSGPTNIRIKRNEKNEGYARANNQGAEMAEGEFLVFMNNDVVVGPGWLEKMLETYYFHPQTGIVGVYSDNVSGRQNIFTAPPLLKPFGNIRIVTFCALVNKQRFQEVGLWNETFPGGQFTDDDLSLRFREKGYQNWIAPVFVMHFGSRTLLLDEKKYQQDFKRAQELFEDKWRNKLFEGGESGISEGI